MHINEDSHLEAEYEDRTHVPDDGSDFIEDHPDLEPDDSMDGDHDSAMASAGFGTDEDYGHAGDFGSEDW